MYSGLLRFVFDHPWALMVVQGGWMLFRKEHLMGVFLRSTRTCRYIPQRLIPRMVLRARQAVER